MKEMCCENMETTRREGIIGSDYDGKLSLKKVTWYGDGEGHMDEVADYYPIHFCPFCGVNLEDKA